MQLCLKRKRLHAALERKRPKKMSLAKKTFELLQQLSKRVENLEAAKTAGLSGSKRSQDNVDSDLESGGEEEPRDKRSRTFEISSPMKEFLRAAFCLPKPLENTTRCSLISKFGIPEGDEAHCPKMDSIIKGELQKEALDVDKKLSRLQNFSLDIADPLVYALEELSTKESPSCDTVTMAIQEALVLLGNASCHMSVERRAKALAKLNPNLKSMAEEEDYSKAQPFLFVSSRGPRSAQKP